MITVIIVIVVMGLFFTIFSSAPKPKTKINISCDFKTKINSKDILAIIIKLAKNKGYKIDEIDENGGRITLSSKIGTTNWGDYYLISITKKEQGENIIKIGIKPKNSLTLELTSMINKRLQQFCTDLKIELINKP